MNLWHEIKNVRSLYEIIRSVNATKFDNIWKQTTLDIEAIKEKTSYFPCDDVLKSITFEIDNVHKELKEFYLSGFNTSKDQLDSGIQQFNEAFLGGKMKDMTDLCYSIIGPTFWNILSVLLNSIMSGMKTISVNIIIDNDMTIHNMGFHPASYDRLYNINFIPHENKTLHISIMNATFEGIYISLQGSHLSMFVKDSIFNRSGIQIDPQFNVNHQPVVIDNSTFLGDIIHPAVAIINTTNVSVTNSRFQNLQCADRAVFGQAVSVVICHNSQLELRNVSIDGCVCLNTVVIHHSNVTASYVEVKNNQNSEYQMYDSGKLLSTDQSILHIDYSTFEQNLNNILMHLESSYVNINLCTFRNNIGQSAIEAGRTSTGSDSSCFMTIQNTIFANNTDRAMIGDFVGGIIYSFFAKVNLINVTLAHNHGRIVSCYRSVIKMMSCEFTNNIITVVRYDQSNVTVTNSVFQRNNGNWFYLQDSNITVTKSHFQRNYGNLFIPNRSNLTVVKSHFSHNLNPDSGGIFFVYSYSYVSHFSTWIYYSAHLKETMLFMEE